MFMAMNLNIGSEFGSGSEFESDLKLHCSEYGSEFAYGYEFEHDQNLFLSLSLSLSLSGPGTPRNKETPAGGRKVTQARTKSLSNKYKRQI
jgi:hypothetical protein